MGKAALFLVLATTIGLTYQYANFSSTAVNREDEQSAYEEAVLARELANSAFNVALGKASFDFDNFRANIRENGYGDGYFDYVVSGAPGDPVNLSAVGYVGRSSYEIDGTLEKTGVSALAALTIDGPVNNVKAAGNSFIINGIDTNPPGVTTPTNAPAYGLRVTKADEVPDFTNEIDADQMVGYGGENSVISGLGTVDLDLIEGKIQDFIEANKTNPEKVQIFNSNQKWTGNMVFGKRSKPVVLFVNGDLDIVGTVDGYGILYVTGQVTIPGTPRWEGLVFVSNPGGKHSFVVKGTPDFYGAVIIRSSASTLPLDFTITGRVGINYSSNALSLVPVSVPMPDAIPMTIQLTNVHETAYQNDQPISLTNLGGY